jgi:hypothetical protein
MESVFSFHATTGFRGTPFGKQCPTEWQKKELETLSEETIDVATEIIDVI